MVRNYRPVRPTRSCVSLRFFFRVTKKHFSYLHASVMQLCLRRLNNVSLLARAHKNRPRESTPKFSVLFLPRRNRHGGFLNTDVNYPRVVRMEYVRGNLNYGVPERKNARVGGTVRAHCAKGREEVRRLFISR